MSDDPADRGAEIRALIQGGSLDEAEAMLAHAGSVLSVADRLALEGMVAWCRRDLARAVERLETSLGATPTYHAATLLASIHLSTGDAGAARGPLATALRFRPESSALRTAHRKLQSRETAPVRPPLHVEGTVRPLSIWFCQPKSIPYDGRTPRERPLGGTESAVVYLTEALVALGQDVRVYNTTCEPVSVEGVEYRSWTDARADAVLDPPDVLVAIRDWSLIGATRFAPLQILWTGDAPDQPAAKGLAEAANRESIDLFAFGSQWQVEAFCSAAGLPVWRTVRIGLGFAPMMIPDEPLADRKSRLVYASTPFRGLELLLDWFPRIRESCPEAELRVFSSMRVYGMAEAEDRQLYGHLYEKACQPGVELLGSVAQPGLAREYRRARLLAYPNVWPETFCVTVAEAQAAGCPVVTSTLGALPETVGAGGICIPGDPRADTGFRDRFIEEIVGLLRHRDRWEALSTAAKRGAEARFSYEVVAGRWLETCRLALTGEDPLVVRVAHHVRNGRAALASRMLEKEGRPSTMTAPAWDWLREFTAWMSDRTSVAPGHWERATAMLGPIRRLPGFDAWAGLA
ncbi:MAG TPA: glycosyltransferase [Vicinamibacterales bacterium]|jgi:glycosyltransferase involved in cell wall biosynthesis